VSAEAIEPLNPHPPFIATAPARVLLATLEKGLGARAPFVLLTGDKGTGKSMLTAQALERWGDRVSVAELPVPAPEPGALATTLLELLGGTAKSGANPHTVMDRLLNVLANVTAGGRVAMLVADDAHTLTPAHVLELQRITGAAANRQCPLELLLVGSPALEAMFGGPELAALHARVSVRAHVAPLSPNETREYLQLRPNSAGGPSSGLFSRKASRDIYHASLGVLGTIEALAAESTRRAQRAGSSTVSPEHVRAAANALRAGRSDDVAHTLPPRQTRGTPAVITPLPTRPAAATPDSKRVPAADLQASNDERVKEWVARFGGSGVRIGAHVPQQRSLDDSETFEVGSVVVTRHCRQTAAAAELAEVSEPVTAGPAEVTPIAAATNAAMPAAVARPRKLIRLEDWSESPESAAARRGTPLAPAPRPASRAPAPMLYLTLGVAIVALAISQHEPIGRLMSAVGSNVTRANVAPAAAHAPPPDGATPAPPVAGATPEAPGSPQYAIAVGSFSSRDMALAEADYMGRLVPLRVKVARAGEGGHGYRLLLGKFDSADAAELSMRRLQGRGLIPDAKTVELPSATSGASEKPARHTSRHRHGRRH
jgi:type II secretory pathway predicted ATPase ExeA